MMIGKTISEVFAINSENEIVAIAQPSVVIPYDWYTELCNQIGRVPSEDEQRTFYGVEHGPSETTNF